MSTTSPEVQAALRLMPGLLQQLAAERNEKVKVSPDGQVAVRQRHRWKSVSDEADASVVRSLAGVIAEYQGHIEVGQWHLRLLASGHGWAIFGERRPGPLRFELAEAVSRGLLDQTRRGGTALIVGPPGSGKAELLRWLAHQLGRKSLVYVSELPPIDLSGPTATHVYPAANSGERRALERLVRAHDCVLWDRVSTADDLAVLLEAPGVHHRWLSLDARGAEQALLKLDRLGAGRPRVDFACLAVTGLDAEQNPVLDNLLCFEQGAWREHHARAESLVEWLEGCRPNEAEGERDWGADLARTGSAPTTPAAPTPAQAPEVQGFTADHATQEVGGERSSGEIDLRSFVEARDARQRGVGSEFGDLRPVSEGRLEAEDYVLEPLDDVTSPEYDLSGIELLDDSEVEMFSEMEFEEGLPAELADFDMTRLTPAAHDEVTALTPLGLDQIRASAQGDELSRLLEAESDDFPQEELGLSPHSSLYRHLGVDSDGDAPE